MYTAFCVRLGLESQDVLRLFAGLGSLLENGKPLRFGVSSFAGSSKSVKGRSNNWLPPSIIMMLLSRILLSQAIIKFS